MSKLKSHPTRIKLNEIPEDGELLEYSKETGELTKILTDLIGKNSYHVRVEIRPLGNAYEISGKINTQLDLICSRCAIDIKHELSHSFRELLLVEKPQARHEKAARANHATEWSEDMPFCTMLESPDFDLAEFVREQVAISEPARPLGSKDCEKSCKNYDRALAKGWISDPTKADDNFKENPFAALSEWKN